MYLYSKISRRRRLSRRIKPGLTTSLGCATLLTLGLILGLFGLTVGFARVVQDLPSLESLPVLLDPPDGLLLQPTLIYDRSGQNLLLNLDNPLAGERLYLSLQAGAGDYIPEAVVLAVLASSQPDFRSSPGFSLDGLFSGAQTTLAQHLVFNLLLQQEEPGLRRNLRERILAGQIVARFGRDKILEWYLNSAAFGPKVYGLEGAAYAYFNKPAAQLSLAEAALLAALAEMPQVDPTGQPDLLMKRQKAILEAMLTSGVISPDQAIEALSAQLSLQPAEAAPNLAPAFTRLALAQLAAALPAADPGRGGLRLITTLDFNLQYQADCTLQTQTAHLAGRGDPILNGPAGQTCQAARLLPTLELGSQKIEAAAGVILLDPETGQILALTSQPLDQIDAASSSGRPAGSLLTPLIYLTAFSRGFTPASLIWDVPGSGPSANPQQTLPAGSSAYYGPLRLRTALANDYFGPAAQLLAQLGRDSILRTADQLNLPVDASQFTSPLETGQLNLVQAAQFYALLANQGVSAGQQAGVASPGQPDPALQPSALLRVERADGQVLLDWSQAQKRPIISTQLAYLMNHILSDEAARWPSLGHPNSLEIGRVAAAKIGSTQAETDGWAFGYTPHWVVGVWLGSAQAPENNLLPKTAAAVWHALSQYLGQNLASEDWPTPPGITKLSVCDPSGMLPTAACPAIVSEVFLQGTEPTQADALYRPIQVNRDSGRLATVFTPPELVEDRVYLAVPPEAAEWARQVGLLIPPTLYDVVYNPAAIKENANFSQPELFSHVRGVVRFTGSAGRLVGSSGADFEFFRLQVGQGLNPQNWLQLGSDNRTPVRSGLLGEWDTSGLSGLYAVQLLVVYSDQRVERAITQITVDNQLPEISILSPAPDSQSAAGSLVLQAAASDNLEVARVDFFIDKKPVGSLDQGPFNLVWQASKGEHTLLVRAVDLAGNQSETQLTFRVK